MNFINKTLIILALTLSYSPFVTANDFAEEIHFKTIEGIDKAGETLSLGVKKLFSPLHKGVEKLAKPYIEKNNAEYYFQLGQAYYTGDVYFNNQYIRKDDEKALDAWTNASFSGSKIAPFILGIMYENGQGTLVNKEKACEWYLKGALLDDVKAQFNTAACYYNGVGFKKDLSEAHKWFLRAAQTGEKDVQYQVAKMYHLGQGTDLNLTLASEWYAKSAAQGHTQAQKQLDILRQSANKPYEMLTTANIKKGQVIDGNSYFVSVVNAAKNGDSKAQFDLGVFYFRGIGVEQDYLQALEWFNKAADQGHGRAKEYVMTTYFALGSEYFSEDAGERQDDTEAFKWFSKAANMGHAKSQYFIGLMYYFGEGVEKNESQGVSWLKKSAQLGFIEAQKLIDEYNL
ncbi:MAG: tetratricopeptide repeat protein [Acinetobacter sp.]